MQNALMMGNGICVIFVGAAGAISKMLVLNEGGFDTQKSLLLILAIICGIVVGELLNLEKQIELPFGKRRLQSGRKL